MEPEDYISQTEAARRLNITPGAILQAVDAGRLASVEIAGRRVIPLSALESYQPRSYRERPGRAVGGRPKKPARKTHNKGAIMGLYGHTLAEVNALVRKREVVAIHDELAYLRRLVRGAYHYYTITPVPADPNNWDYSWEYPLDGERKDAAESAFHAAGKRPPCCYGKIKISAKSQRAAYEFTLKDIAWRKELRQQEERWEERMTTPLTEERIWETALIALKSQYEKPNRLPGYWKVYSRIANRKVICSLWSQCYMEVTQEQFLIVPLHVFVAGIWATP